MTSGEVDSDVLRCFSDALRSAERALQPAASWELRSAQAMLQVLLEQVSQRCREAQAGVGDEAPNPDALDDWYSDPWASPGFQHKVSSNSQRERRGSGKSGEEVETFLLEQLDDAPTEVMDLGLGAQREVAPLEDVLEESFPTASQWQYGRCVALKLVAHSPQGSSAFEQLLSVLLTVFQVTAEERKGSFRSRKSSQSWWRSGLLRCRPADRGQSIPEDDALLP